MDLNQSDNCGNEGCLKLVNSETAIPKFREAGGQYPDHIISVFSFFEKKHNWSSAGILLLL
jgi:hypothetical protein